MDEAISLLLTLRERLDLSRRVLGRLLLDIALDVTRQHVGHVLPRLLQQPPRPAEVGQVRQPRRPIVEHVLLDDPLLRRDGPGGRVYRRVRRSDRGHCASRLLRPLSARPPLLASCLRDTRGHARLSAQRERDQRSAALQQRASGDGRPGRQRERSSEREAGEGAEKHQENRCDAPHEVDRPEIELFPRREVFIHVNGLEYQRGGGS